MLKSRNATGHLSAVIPVSVFPAKRGWRTLRKPNFLVWIVLAFYYWVIYIASAFQMFLGKCYASIL